MLSSALSGDPAVRAVHADAARTSRLTQARGDHVVRAQLGPKGVELALRDGFSLRARAQQSGELSLRVAPVRAQADAIARAFVPIGPSVAVSGDRARADVTYRADAFRVRQGHRLVLAMEQPGCTTEGGCWVLHPATYEDSRCVARGLVVAPGRLQFGSVPVRAPEAPLRSAAPSAPAP